MVNTSILIKSAVLELVAQCEDQLDHQLNDDDKKFIVQTMYDFVMSGVEKFIAGAKEHHADGVNFVSNVDHKRELTNEIIDLWMYHRADLLLSRKR